MAEIAVVLDTCAFRDIDPYELIRYSGIEVFTTPHVLEEIKGLEGSSTRKGRESTNLCHAVEMFRPQGLGNVLTERVDSVFSPFIEYLPKAAVAKLNGRISITLNDRDIALIKTRYLDEICEAIRRAGSNPHGRSARYLGNLFELTLRQEIRNPGIILGHHGKNYNAPNDAKHVTAVFAHNWKDYGGVVMVSRDSDVKAFTAIGNSLYDRRENPIEPIHTHDFVRDRRFRHLFNRH